MKTISTIVIALDFFLTACEKDQIILIPTESPNQRFHQSMEWNRQHPFREIVVSTDNYQILSVADCHVGSTGNLKNFWHIAESTDASGVVMVGDLTNGRPSQYSELRKNLPNQDSLPLFFVAGNHDIYFNGWEEFYSNFGSSTYLFILKTPVARDLFICLETGGGTLGDSQIAWFDNVLKTMRRDYRHCFVFTHNNLFRARHTPSTNPMIEELHVLIELFTKYKVDMVITGHDHKRDDCLFGITRYIQLDALHDGADNASYFKIIIDGNNINYLFEDI